MKDMLQQAEYEWQKHKYDYSPIQQHHPHHHTHRIHPVEHGYRHHRTQYRPYLAPVISSPTEQHRYGRDSGHTSSSSSASYPPTPNTPHKRSTSFSFTPSSALTSSSSTSYWSHHASSSSSTARPPSLTSNINTSSKRKLSDNDDNIRFPFNFKPKRDFLAKPDYINENKRKCSCCTMQI